MTALAASDTIELDTTPPGGSITVTPNPSASSLVTVNSSIDGATFMRFSNNNSLWSAWQTYVATRSNWDLTSAAYGGSAANGTRTVYAQYCDGATGGAGLITRKSASLTFDNTLPSATLSINSGAATTTSGTVTLTISASDNVYGAASLQMQFSNNGTIWSAWETYAATKSGWSLTSGYGGSATQETKTVYLRVKDPLGNGATTNRTDTIVYDYTKPVAGSASINAGAAYSNSSTVTFTLSATDNVYGAGSLQMRFSNNNSTWSAWEAYSTTKSGWSLTTGAGGSTAEGTRTVYAQVSDPAGNVSTTISDSIVYDITPPSGSFSIESGNPATSPYTAAILYFSMTDNLSGVVERRLYDNYNGTWLSWEAYTTSKSWYLTPGNGTKYVYAYFRDGAGNSTAGYLNDSVTLAETYGSLSRNDIVHYGDDYMSTAAISGSDDFASSPLKPGTVLVYKTSDGLYGRLEVTELQQERDHHLPDHQLQRPDGQPGQLQRLRHPGTDENQPQDPRHVRLRPRHRHGDEHQLRSRLPVAAGHEHGPLSGSGERRQVLQVEVAARPA